MPFRKAQGPFTRQPESAIVDLSAPVAPFFAVNLTNSFEGRRGIRGVLSAGASQTVGLLGKGYALAGGSDMLDFGTSPYTSGGGDFSVLYAGRLSTGNFRTAGTIGNGDWLAWGHDGSFFIFTLRGVADLTSNIAVSNGSEYVVLVSYQRGVAATFYVRNVTTGVISKNVVSSASTPSTDATSHLYIGSRDGGAGSPDFGWSDRLYMTALYSRQMPENIARALVMNPWQVWANPARRRIISQVAAGAAAAKTPYNPVPQLGPMLAS